MKKQFFISFFAFFAFVAVANADCTVTTDCGTRTYDVTSLNASISNGDVTVTSNGSVIDTFTCEGATSISSSCNSTTGTDESSFDICDFVPAWLASFFGC